MSDLIEDCRALLSNELQAKDDEIERLTAESEAYRQEYVRLGCENVKLQARAAELEAALRGYVKATTGQKSATVTFPMALEGEGK